jgi:hypothetical protein
MFGILPQRENLPTPVTVQHPDLAPSNEGTKRTPRRHQLCDGAPTIATARNQLTAIGGPSKFSRG